MNARQQQFIEGILSGLSAKDAYIQAGYTAVGDAAKSAASRLLTNVDVQAELTRRQGAVSEQTELTRQEVIAGLRKEGNNPRAPSAARVSAWSWLGKHLAMFTDRVEEQDLTQLNVVLKIVKKRPDDAARTDEGSGGVTPADAVP